jgi:hypothetical protein
LPADVLAEIESWSGPVAHVSADVADAFGMRDLPNVVVHDEKLGKTDEQWDHEAAKEERREARRTADHIDGYDRDDLGESHD